MIIVYVAHPVSGDVEANLEAVRQIVHRINVTRSNVVPLAPYYLACKALDDSNPTQRARGMRNNYALFAKGVIDELWLFGSRLSKGMIEEIRMAHLCGIPVKADNVTIIRDYNNVKEDWWPEVGSI